MIRLPTMGEARNFLTKIYVCPFLSFLSHYDWLSKNIDQRGHYQYYLGISMLLKSMLNNGKTSILLTMPKSFELYNENDRYNPTTLFDYFYNKASQIAQAFDERNGNDFYQSQIAHKLEMIKL